jgi:hypothetical protein
MRSRRNGGGGEGVGFAVAQRGARRLGRVGRVGVEAGQVGVEAVHHHGAEADAHPVLELVGGLDHLVHRGLLGEGDEQHLAALRVAQQLEHVEWPGR